LEDIAMTSAIDTYQRLRVHLDRLTDPADCDMKQSTLMLAGDDQLGLLLGVTACLRDYQANVKFSSGRRWKDIYGSMLLIEAPSDAMSQLTEEAILQSCLQHQQAYELPADRLAGEYNLSILAPDRPGIFATIAELLLKRRIGILTNDSFTFETQPLGETSSSDDILTMASLQLTLAIPRLDDLKTLDSLRSGLRYLEDRYQWYIQLERRSSSTIQLPSLPPGSERQRFMLN
jgi:glycine cleavage system regulatory protein